MKITDKGLERILSLGLIKATDSVGVYYIYSWKAVDYYCGLASSKKNHACSDLKGLFIGLTERQFESLPLAGKKASNDPILKRISAYFETVVFLKYKEEQSILETHDYTGQNKRASYLRIDMETPSPFSIARETEREFHGFFSSSSDCKDSLEKAFFKTEKLWISARPIFKDAKFIGIVAAFSQNKEYGLDVLDLLKTFNPEIETRAA